MNNKEELKNRLRHAMTVNNIKAVELSERTGIPKGAISYYMSGRSTPKADRIFLISEVLGINEAWLLGYDAPMERERSDKQKKNDKLSELIVKMREDSEFFEVVALLSELLPAQRASIKQILESIVNK